MSGEASRRDFLRAAAAAGTALGLGGACSGGRAVRRGSILGAGRFLTTDTGKMTHVLCVFDLDADRSRAISMDFFGHGLVFHPTDRNRVVVFEKKGPGACEIDLAAGRVTRPITTPPERAFYGHGAFSRDGQVLFATENHLQTRNGLIAIRDARTHQPLGEFPTHGQSPHDCHLVDDGKTLVITNGGGPQDSDALPSVTFVDVASTKLLERLTFTTPRINAGHLALSAQRDVVAISAPREGMARDALGGVTIRTGRGPFETMDRPQEVVGRMAGESLSLCIDEARRVVAVTNPDGNIVTFWDLDGKRLVKHLDLPAPRGLARTVDGGSVALSYGQGTLALLDPETMTLAPTPVVASSTLSGSHIFSWDRPG
ncbi:MAG: DUF1513 domain-containing protein [Vicinamibacteria bacterium]